MPRERKVVVQAFLRGVLPSTGPYGLASFNGKKMLRHYASSIEELADRARSLTDEGQTVYYTVASFKDAGGRQDASNVAALKCLRLDCGQEKAKKGQGYADLKAAAGAVDKFVADTKLPDPWVVFSGGGLHIYWTLTEAVEPDVWRRYAEGLKGACARHGLLADAGITADPAHLLRLPDPLDWKSTPPKPVAFDETNLECGPYALSEFDWLRAYEAERPASEGSGQPAVEAWSPGHEGYLCSQLFKLCADVPYPEWFKIIAGVHSLGWGAVGFGMADDWSKTA